MLPIQQRRDANRAPSGRLVRNATRGLPVEKRLGGITRGLPEKAHGRGRRSPVNPHNVGVLPRAKPGAARHRSSVATRVGQHRQTWQSYAPPAIEFEPCQGQDCVPRASGGERRPGQTPSASYSREAERDRGRGRYGRQPYRWAEPHRPAVPDTA